jgi:hypothetical protein
MSCDRSITFAPASQTAFSWASLKRSSYRLRSSWCASTWMYSQWKERPPQVTSIVFRTLECLHLVGMRYGGSSAVRPRAPRRSEYIFTRPASPGETVFTASSSRCIAIRPSNSPLEGIGCFGCLWERAYQHPPVPRALQDECRHAQIQVLFADARPIRDRQQSPLGDGLGNPGSSSGYFQISPKLCMPPTL